MLIAGHRGARGEAPENTLSGFNYLKSLGIKSVELDVQITADQQLVVFHDQLLQPKSTGVGYIANQSLAELKQLQIQHDYFLVAEKIPTLNEVLEIINDFDHIQLEVKVFASNRLLLDALAQQIAVIYQQYPQQVIVTSFSVGFLKLLQQKYPYVVRGLLLEEYCFGHPDYDNEDYDAEIFWPTDKALALAQELACQWIIPQSKILNKHHNFVREAHAQGLNVSTWTVNLEYEMQDLTKMGVDSMITDFPKRAIQTLMPTGKL